MLGGLLMKLWGVEVESLGNVLPPSRQASWIAYLDLGISILRDLDGERKGV